MPFHPESLTKACLKDLAKNLQKGAPDAIWHRIKLSQAQELLVRSLGHASWNDALSRALTNHTPPPPPETSKPLVAAHEYRPPVIHPSARGLSEVAISYTPIRPGSIVTSRENCLGLTKEEVLCVDGMLPLLIFLACSDYLDAFEFISDRQALTGWTLQAHSLFNESHDSFGSELLQCVQAITTYLREWEKREPRRDIEALFASHQDKMNAAFSSPRPQGREGSKARVTPVSVAKARKSQH